MRVRVRVRFKLLECVSELSYIAGVETGCIHASCMCCLSHLSKSLSDYNLNY